MGRLKLGSHLGEGCEKAVFTVKGRKNLVVAVSHVDDNGVRALADLKGYQKELKKLSKAGIRTPKTYRPRRVTLDKEEVWGLPMQRLKYHIWTDRDLFWDSVNKKTAADAAQMLKALVKHQLVSVDIQFMTDAKGRLYAMDPGEVRKVKTLDIDDAYSAWCAVDQLVGITMYWELKKSKNKELRKLATSEAEGDFGYGAAIWVLLQNLVTKLATKVKLGKWELPEDQEPPEDQED